MRKIIKGGNVRLGLAIVVTISGLMLTGVVFAEGAECGASQAPVAQNEKTSQLATQEVQPAVAAPVEVGNKICPVSGEKIPEGEAYKVEYKGKIYNLCCSMCEKDFNKDPETYIKKVEDELNKNQEVTASETTK